MYFKKERFEREIVVYSDFLNKDWVDWDKKKGEEGMVRGSSVEFGSEGIEFGRVIWGWLLLLRWITYFFF